MAGAPERAASLERLVARLGSRLPPAERTAILDELDRRREEASAALEWLYRQAAQGDAALTERGVRLAAQLGWFWLWRGHVEEGRSWLSRFLALPTPGEESSALLRARADALLRACNLAHHQGQMATARALAEQSLRLARQLGDTTMAASALQGIGLAYEREGNPAAAARALDECLAAAREAGEPKATADALHSLGLVRLQQGDLDGAQPLVEESVSLLRARGDPLAARWPLLSLAAIHRRRGAYDAARRLAAESLALRREVGDRWGIASAQRFVAQVELEAGRAAAASGPLAEAIQAFRDLGDQWELAHSLEVASAWAASTEAFPEAARLIGAAEALAAGRGTRAPQRAEEWQKVVAAVREPLGEERFGLYQAAGRTLPVEEAVSSALALLRSRGGGAGERAAGRPVGQLSPREREVAALVARGLSNREIARSLWITERTVEKHVERVLGKLALERRSQVAGWVAARGLGVRARRGARAIGEVGDEGSA